MQEEISLREIIETIWNGKYLIIGITILSMLISGIFSFFMMTPTYQTTALLRVSVDDSNKALLNSLIETTKSDVSIYKIIEKLQLQELYTIDDIRNRIDVKLVNNTNVVSIKVQGKDPKMITDIANLTAFEFGARTEITERSAEIVELKLKLEELEDEIIVVQNEIEEVQAQLAVTPEKLITNRVLADDAYLLSIEQERSLDSNRNVGALELQTEEINPLFLSLKAKVSDLQVNMERTTTAINNLNARIEEHQTIINTLENHIYNERLSARSSLRLLNGSSAIFVSPALEPTNPIGPNKKLNIAIAMVVGLLVSVFIVFFKQYWINTAPNSRELK